MTEHIEVTFVLFGENHIAMAVNLIEDVFAYLRCGSDTWPSSGGRQADKDLAEEVFALAKKHVLARIDAEWNESDEGASR